MATHSSILAWRSPMDRGAWQVTVHWVTKESDTTGKLNNNTSHLNAKFQRIARRDKKAFLSNQCKERGKQQNGKD